MSMLDRLKGKLRKYDSVEEREKRKLEHAHRTIDRLTAQAGKAKLQARRMEIKRELSEAKTKLAIARAREREAEAAKKKAEREVWEERSRKIRAVIGTLAGARAGGSSSPKRKGTRKTRKSRR